MILKTIPIIEKEEVFECDIVEPSDREVLEQELNSAAVSLLRVCNCKLRLGGEDLNLTELKELTRVVKDVRTAFFDNKQAQATNNTQINISGSSLQFFQGVLKC